MNIEEQLILHEGLRLKPYRDTIKGHLTIGVGRNLDVTGITRDEAIHLLRNDLVRVRRELSAALPFFTRLSPIRRQVLIDMAFNLGTRGLLKFKKMLAAIDRGDYEIASIEMLSSKWATQVGKRAQRLALMIRLGIAVAV